MEQKDAERYAEILRSHRFNVVARRQDFGRWEVKGVHALGGWTELDRMPLDWQRVITKHTKGKDPNKMDKHMAGRYAAALRARTGNLAIRAIPDISHGNDGNWGIEDGDESYWEYDQFPEEYRREIQAYNAVSNGAAAEEITVTMTRLQAGVTMGALAAEVYAAGAGEYGDLIGDVVRKLGLSLVRGA